MRSTGWPHTGVPLTEKSIAPQACWPAGMPAFVQVAPFDVAWQLQPFQPEELWLTAPPPPLLIVAPAGSEIVTVTCPLAAEPVSRTWKKTVPEPPELWLYTLTVAARCTVADGVGLGGLGVGFGLGVGGFDVTVGAGLGAECVLLGAGLWADLEGDADAAGVVRAGGDAAASACGL